MRTVYTIIATILFILSYDSFLAFHELFESITVRLWVNGTFLFALAFLLTDFIIGLTTTLHRQFFIIFFSSVIVNLFLIELYYIFPITILWQKLLILNGGILFISVCVLFSGLRHKLF
jgi:hypothetical protein